MEFETGLCYNVHKARAKLFNLLFWGESVIKRLFALSFLVALLAAGCGGGGGSAKPAVESISRSISLATSPTFDDGTHYVSFSFVCIRTGNAAVKASSTAFDPMLMVEKMNPDGSSETVACDDDGGGGTSALATFEATAGTRYTAYVLSAGADADGQVVLEYPTALLSPVSE